MHTLRNALTLLAVLIGFSLPALGQDWPAKRISLVVAFAPGGSTDLMARLIAARLKDVLGQQVIVENRAGAGGSIGAAFVTKAAPDGYTLLLATGSLPLNQVLNKNVPFDILRDLVPVTQIAYQPLVLVVHRDFPVKTLRELVPYVKESKTPLNYGSAGSGSTPHLAGALLNYVLGEKMAHVPYQGGGPAAVALLGRHVDIVMSAFGEVMPHIKSGQLRPLGVTTRQASPTLPDVPPISSVIPEWSEMATWHGIMAPTNTPPEVLAKLNVAMKSVLQDAEIKNMLAGIGGTIVAGSAVEFRQMISADLEKIARLVKLSGATVQ
jgi:tripartite-type tricarboxylate transporter receptor subunit TctC